MTKLEWLLAGLRETNDRLEILQIKMIANCSLQVREQYVETLIEKVNLEKEIFNEKKEDLSLAMNNMFGWIEKEIMGV
jgi:hypothetical protein